MDDLGKILGGLVLVAGGALALGPGGGVARITSGPRQQGLILVLAGKWGTLFGCPVPFIMAIAKVESDFRPGAYNAQAVKQGGAWGCLQVTRDTQETLANKLNASTNVQVKANLAMWRAQGPKALLVADVGVMFGAKMLGDLVREFGVDLPKVAAAYHQGPGTVRKLLAAKQPFPGGLPTKGRDYVAKATAAAGEKIA